MEIEEIEILIYKYLFEKITPEEEHCLLDWLNMSPENKQFFLEMKVIHQALNFYAMDSQEQNRQISQSLNELKKQMDANLLNQTESE